MNSRTDRKAKAKSYRKSAKDVERGAFEFCCHSLQANGLGCSQIEALFRPSIKEVREYFPCGNWHEDDDHYSWGFFFDHRGDSGHNGRVLMLCFMAAMVEAGDA